MLYRHIDFLLVFCTAELPLSEDTQGILLHRNSDVFRYVNQETEVRRSRRLVILYMASVGIYTYAIHWYFQQDGAIHYVIKIIGNLNPDTVTSSPDIDPSAISNEHQVGRGYDQHTFTIQIDWMLDGHQNSLVEVNCETIAEGVANPLGNAWSARETVIRTMDESHRKCDPQKSRYWKVINSQAKNFLDIPVGYKFAPLNVSSTIPLHQTEGLQSSASLDQHYIAAGKFDQYLDCMNESGGCGFVHEHENRLKQQREKIDGDCLVDCDLITWTTMRSINVTRPEDWPTLSPIENIGFRLVPVGFFSGNPALDVPRPNEKHCHHL